MHKLSNCQQTKGYEKLKSEITLRPVSQNPQQTSALQENTIKYMKNRN